MTDIDWQKVADQIADPTTPHTTNELRAIANRIDAEQGVEQKRTVFLGGSHADTSDVKQLLPDVYIDARQGSVYINGERFPFYLSEYGPTVTSISHSDVMVVNLPLLASEVEIKSVGSD